MPRIIDVIPSVHQYGYWRDYEIWKVFGSSEQFEVFEKSLKILSVSPTLTQCLNAAQTIYLCSGLVNLIYEDHQTSADFSYSDKCSRTIWVWQAQWDFAHTASEIVKQCRLLNEALQPASPISNLQQSTSQSQLIPPTPHNGQIQWPAYFFEVQDWAGERIYNDFNQIPVGGHENYLGFDLYGTERARNDQKFAIDIVRCDAVMWRLLQQNSKRIDCAGTKEGCGGRGVVGKPKMLIGVQNTVFYKAFATVHETLHNGDKHDNLSHEAIYTAQISFGIRVNIPWQEIVASVADEYKYLLHLLEENVLLLQANARMG